MSICDTCKYASFYPKPEMPENGFPSDIIGKRTGIAKWFFGENIYRGGADGYWDDEKWKYEYKLEWHKNKVWCEALPNAKQVDKHDTCSFYRAVE